MSSDETKATCPVCGDPIGPAPVVCPRCRTPHHWDCWEYNKGCATYGCSVKTKKRNKGPGRSADSPGKQLTGKIPFPHLSSNKFYGLFFVTPLTAIWCIFFELAAIVALASSENALGLAFLLAMLLGLLWAALTSEGYNFDFEKKRLTYSKYFLWWEIYERQVCRLDDIFIISVVQKRADMTKTLTAQLQNGRLLRLTPPYPDDSPDNAAVEALLRKLEQGSTLPIDRENARSPLLQ